MDSFNRVAEALETLSDELFRDDVNVQFTGETLLVNNEMAAESIADFLEHIGFDYVNTGYYDPDEDERNDTRDGYTGKWYVSVD